ncbi:hypothetical protein [Aureliella helgolandensis]|uniref:hypothetical protein n=1 Tax=Aureliella helgolandensis TaxID=2527968 RepID=UPI0011A670F9|nr:hypothetical protein [Aureliella helgolandensis]
MKGKPYTDASVMVIDLSSGQGGGADLKSDGTFTLDDPIPVGSYTAYFAPISVPPEDASAAPVPMQADKTIPQKYWNEASSDLKFEVKEGKNEFPIDIK